MNYHIERVGRKAGSMLLLLCAVTLIAWSQKEIPPAHATDDMLSQKGDGTFHVKDNSQSGFTENKERNCKEGITFTVDEANKEILTSKNGEICVKIPRWKEFTTAYLTDNYGHEILNMVNDANYDMMTYELIASWDRYLLSAVL